MSVPRIQVYLKALEDEDAKKEVLSPEELAERVKQRRIKKGLITPDGVPVS